ncbi:MAG: DUF2148 domain-containing protein [Candidatus Omnitrophica bacterium]|nr:DUF2148 domain-containing protein [Candidatus Omnitrophota bacterium]
MKRSAELEKEAIMAVAEFMAAAARTAPKARGIDNIEVLAIDDELTKKRLIEKMKELAKKENRPTLERDAGSIAASPIIVMIGTRANPVGLNCGFCGHKTCEELKKSKGVCAYNPLDLGIAAGSAVSAASRFHIDNRIMYSIGLAALELDIFGKEVKMALGIPLSVTSKNPFFDRK